MAWIKIRQTAGEGIGEHAHELESVSASSLVTAQAADTGICRCRPCQGALFLDCGYSATGESPIVDGSI